MLHNANNSPHFNALHHENSREHQRDHHSIFPKSHSTVEEEINGDFAWYLMVCVHMIISLIDSRRLGTKQQFYTIPQFITTPCKYTTS